MYSFADFLKDGFVPELRLMTGRMDFSSILVTGSSVQEFPLDNFIRSGEIVLSTAIGYENRPAFFGDMIRDIHAAGAAAIAFSFKDPNYLLPKDAAVYAESCGLPVFQMPWEYRFSDFQTSLREAIRRKEEAVFRGVQSTLFNYFFESRPIEQAVEYLGRTFHCLVEIESIAGETIAAAGEPQTGAGVRQISMDIQIGNTVFSRLKLYAAAGGESLPAGKMLEKYVAFPLSLWFHRRTVEDITAARLKNDFVWKLAEDGFPSEEEMLRQGGYLRFRLSRPYSCIAMRFILQKTESTDASNPWRNAHYTADVEQTLLLEAKRRGQAVMVGSRGAEFVIYFENSGSGSSQKISAYLDAVEEAVQKKFSDLTCYWGISESYSERAEFARLYKNAASALHYCINSREKSRRFTYQKTKKVQIISLLSDSSEMRDSARQLLGRIVRYDADSRIDLLNTLSAYIQANYNASQTARDMHLNRQSLLYRLEKIESITGMSLDNHDDLFVLEVFLHVYFSM